MGRYCPFCLGPNVKPVGKNPETRVPDCGGSLMECEECEKWFWADRKEEAAALFRHCQTIIIHPQRCYEEVREAVLSAGTSFPKRRLAEFNHLCTECPHGKFLPRPESSGRLKTSGLRETGIF